AARVELFELFEIKSAAATRSYLVPRGPGAMEQRDGHSVAAFLDSLPEENRALAALALRRIGRIDTDLAVQPAEDGVSWLLAGELLCAMEWGTEGLNAQTVSGEPTVIGDEGDLDSFLEQVLGDYVAGLDKVGQTAERGAGDGPGDGPADQDEGEGWLDLDQVDKLSSEALLTPEEIEAFRD
ncbi:MAG: hypothetical protein QF599_14340, partial [Planctomycetota bacterium]|nr:hypothetical protein [Planctomycetota bacterium]